MEDNTATPQGIELPDDLSTLDAAGLQSLQDKIHKAFEKLNGKDKVNAAELAQMGVLADQRDQILEARTALEAAEAETAAERQRLAQRMGAGEDAESGDEGTEGGDAEESVEAPSEDAGADAGDTENPEADPAPDAASEATVAEVVAIDTNTEGETVDTPTVGDALAASTGTRAPAQTTDRPSADSRQMGRANAMPVTIVASSGIPGVSEGKELADKAELSTAMHKRARNMTDRKGKGDFGALVASISLNDPQHVLSESMSDSQIHEVWDAAHSVQDNLVASGGWCRPSDTIYDFACDFEAMPEALDLPTVTAVAGVRYPIAPQLGDVIDDVNSGFTWTEDDDIAAAQPGGPTKPCFKIGCPEFDEVRLQAQGICVTAGNLTDKAWPQLTNRYVDLVMTAHAHRMNGLTIAKVVASSQPVAPTVVDLSAAEAILASIELQIAAARDQFFMAEDAILEVVLPRWVRTVIRRDLARRYGQTFDQISNSEIAAFFGEIGARVQFVSDWQSLRVPPANPGDPFLGLTQLPTTVDILIYPAGAHTRLDGGSIDLGVVRDSTLNATNDFTAAWTEEFWQVLSRCFSLVVTVPLCANGWTGAPHEIACPTA